MMWRAARAVVGMYWILVGWPGPMEMGPFPERADCEEARAGITGDDGTCEPHLSEWPEP